MTWKISKMARNRWKSSKCLGARARTRETERERDRERESGRERERERESTDSAFSSAVGVKLPPPSVEKSCATGAMAVPTSHSVRSV